MRSSLRLEDNAFYKYAKAKCNEEKRANYPDDVVILHQFPRGLNAPSPSPFALKLETWLRMADIKYQVRGDFFPHHLLSLFYSFK
jgi:hypothetical protein